MLNILYTICLFCALSHTGISQNAAPYVNSILDENILTVQLNLGGQAFSNLPILSLAQPGSVLSFEFDHYGPEFMNYIYMVEHCNHDWTKSNLEPAEYMDGFQEDRILNFESSFNALTDYTHYKVMLPNQNIKWNKSGNYVLKVYDETEGERTLVMIRKFMVVERLLNMEAQFTRTTKLEQTNTHHEIKFTATPQKGLQIYNTQSDITAYVVQNGWIENAIGPLKPNFTRGNTMIFDKVGQIVFPAGKEFRFFDMRAMDIRGEYIKDIVEKEDYYQVTLKTDESRFDRPIVFRADANGQYIIENRNFNRTLLESEYATVLFSIKRNAPFDNEDVYVFGALTDWQLKPEFKMQYLEEAKMYYCEPFLKQGYYNYQYVVVNRETGEIDEDGLEGNWYETQHTYTILVYYRPQGTRFDRLVAMSTL